MHLITSSKQLGFTLVELMISLAISTIIISSLITMFSINLKHNNDSMNAIRLNQELQAAINVMSDDIRRAGYWASASNDLGTGTNTNPFMVTGSTDISVNAGNDCILFSYDRDSSGTLPALNSANDDNRYGYRLTSGKIQSRSASANFSCSASPTNWDDLTDANIINITNLAFALNTNNLDIDEGGAGTAQISIRDVTITISGQLADDTSVSKTISNTIRVRNDKYIP